MDNLTRCSIAAQKAGMSYGKYMANRPQTKETPDLTGYKPCKWCGELFYTTRKDKKYCCADCASKYSHRKRLAEKKGEAHA